MFRVALVSRWHLHAQKPDERYTKEFLKQADCKIVCVWDEHPEIAAEWAKELNVPAEMSLDALLARADVDGIIVTSATAEHKRIMLAAAKAGKHIFTEKALAFTVEDAEEIRRAVRESGVKFCISFPHIATKRFAYARTLLERGTLGDPVMFRCLNGHRGGLNGDLPEYWFDPDICGGGAMMDLGCHPAYLAQYILGHAKSVSSSFSYYLGRRVEDNASCNVMYENGTMGVLESTFTSQLLGVYEMAVYGTKGTYYARLADYPSELALIGQPVKKIPDEEIPSAGMTPMERWISACTKGTEIKDCGIDEAVELVKLMVAAYESDRENGRRVTIG